MKLYLVDQKISMPSYGICRCAVLVGAKSHETNAFNHLNLKLLMNR